MPFVGGTLRRSVGASCVVRSVIIGVKVIGRGIGGKDFREGHFGEEPFQRGNLDAGRLSWLFGREVVAAEDPFNPASYDAWLKIDVKRAEMAFPEVFAADAAPYDFDADDDGSDDA